MKKEIVALTDSIGVDGHQKKKHIWIGALRIIAWKDDTLHTEEKMVNWTTTYDGLNEMANVISGNMVIKLLVEDKNTHFNLLEVVDAPTIDKELEIIQQEVQKPIYYQDKALGKFKYDKQFDWFTKKVSWDKEKGYAYIKSAEPTLLNQNFKYLATLLGPNYLQRTKVFTSKELAPLTEEWIGNSLSEPELLENLKFKELVMNSNGDFTVYLEARKLFGEHVIQVEGNFTQGLKSAYI